MALNKYDSCGGRSVDCSANTIPGLAEKLSQSNPLLTKRVQKVDEEWRQKRRTFLQTKIYFEELKSVTENAESIHLLTSQQKLALSKIHEPIP